MLFLFHLKGPRMALSESEKMVAKKTASFTEGDDNMLKKLKRGICNIRWSYHGKWARFSITMAKRHKDNKKTFDWWNKVCDKHLKTMMACYRNS